MPKVSHASKFGVLAKQDHNDLSWRECTIISTRELRRDQRLSHISQASDVKTSSRTLSSGEGDSVSAKICVPLGDADLGRSDVLRYCMKAQARDCRVFTAASYSADSQASGLDMSSRTLAIGE